MEYSVVVLPTAKKDLESLDPPWRARVIERLAWLAANADQVAHHRLQGVPDDLSRLCRFRVGDYRVLYWKIDPSRTIEVFHVEHRSKAYKKL